MQKSQIAAAGLIVNKTTQAGSIPQVFMLQIPQLFMSLASLRDCLNRLKKKGLPIERVPMQKSMGAGPAIRSRSMVIQQKTGRPVQFEITADTRASLLAWLERRGGTIDDFAFPSRVVADGHLSTRQYARLVDEWVTAIGLTPEEYGTHSLRRTKASLIYKATGNLRAIQILLGHSKIENTVRYLGVDVDDALSLSEATEI